MTPNELYAVPSRSVITWYDDYRGIFEDVLKIDAPDHHSIKDAGADLLEVHDKLYYDEDGERGVSIDAMYFEGHPFALMFTGGRGGRDSRTPVVTDMARWAKAREYVLSVLNRGVQFDGDVVSPDDELTDGYYGAKLAAFGDEIRLVAYDSVSPLSGNAVYDDKKFHEHFDRTVRPLGSMIGYEDGLADPKMMAAGIEAFRAGVLGRAVWLDIDIDKDTKLIAASEVDGQTFVHVIHTRGKYYTWARGLSSHMVGPASLLECYDDTAGGRPVADDCRYVKEAADAFGASPALVHAVLTDFLRQGGSSLAERIIDAMPRDERVPEELSIGYSSFAAGFMVNDNPGLRRFMASGYPDESQALELIEKAGELSRKIALGEIKRPSM